jgi:hypothetical protein
LAAEARRRKGRPLGSRKSKVDLAVLDIAQRYPNIRLRQQLRVLIPMFYRITPATTMKQIVRRLEDLSRADKKGVPRIHPVEHVVFPRRGTK